MRKKIEEKNLRESFEKVKKDIDDLGERMEMLEKSQSQKSLTKSQAVSLSLTKSQSQNKIETKIISKIKRNKKSFVIVEINKLIPFHSTIEIFETIVKEKGLCSKASFYRYISSLKSQSQPTAYSNQNQNGI